jgi:hypothetical protein
MRHLIIVLALVTVSIGQAHAQSDSLAAAKAAVQACVKDVRDQAKRPENFQFGAPPMWKDFDAYIAPDGRVFSNVRLVGEQDGYEALRSDCRHMHDSRPRARSFPARAGPSYFAHPAARRADAGP